MVHLNAAELPPRSMGRQMSRMMDQLSKGSFSFFPGETWTPAVNLYETAGDYRVCVDLAGVEKDKITVEVGNGRLLLKGTREVPTPGRSSRKQANAKVRVHLMEIDHGPFTREVELPEDVIPEKISAVYSDGWLWIELPKRKV